MRLTYKITYPTY